MRDWSQPSAIANEVSGGAFLMSIKDYSVPPFNLPSPPYALVMGCCRRVATGGPPLPSAISGVSYLRGFTFTTEQPNCACNNGDQLLHNRASPMKHRECVFNMQ